MMSIRKIAIALVLTVITTIGVVSHASATAYNGFVAADITDVQTTYTNMIAAYMAGILSLFGVRIAINWAWRKLHQAAPR